MDLAPRQKRSERSRERLLDAAERLMEHHHFEDISITRIAAEAGTSVGNFYARFASKEALLDALQDRYERDRAEAWRSFFDDPSLGDMSLAGAIHALTKSAIEKYRARRGVFRTLVIRQWRNPERLGPRSQGMLRRLYDDAFRLLWNNRDEIRHANRERAVRVGLAAMLASARENVVMRPRDLPGSLSLSDEELATELSHMLHAYLTAAPSSAYEGKGPLHE